MTPAYYILADANVRVLWERARADYDVVAKTRDADGNLAYGRPAAWDAVAFVDEQPRLSAKEAALPQTETLVEYRREEGRLEAEAGAAAAREVLLFGVNLCDAAAFEIIDKVFAWDFKDDPYLDRRARMTRFALACAAPQQDCFCDRIAADEEGVDAVAYPVESGYLVKVQTEKGAALAAKYADLFGAAGADAGPQLDAHLKEGPLAKKEPLLEKARPGLAQAFEHGDWKHLVSTCIGCGVCTYLCPTCHCFDIQDEGGTARGRRLRTWDHCTGRTFTQMPAHQPRDRQYKRYRQRLLHKFSYYPERFGPLLCTGCGRCITQCPVKINIKELVEYFGGLKDTPPGGARGK